MVSIAPREGFVPDSQVRVANKGRSPVLCDVMLVLLLFLKCVPCGERHGRNGNKQGDSFPVGKKEKQSMFGDHIES